ncbi:MAG: hypothetical protein JRF25_00925, partial [Deltaproteobacteria bacterium]|nr:hypothetical protein [Deltaproteobacteria bacterium]
KNPDLLMELCEKIYTSQWNYYEAYRDMAGPPVGALQCSYAFNQHMLSFDDAWKFEGQFIARFAKESGLPLIIHNCGFKPYHIELIEKLQQEGIQIQAVNASHPLDIDWWVEFRKKYPEITIMGGLHVSAEMENGTPQRLVITPTCCMPWRVPLSNIKAVVEAVEKFGAYPINID